MNKTIMKLKTHTAKIVVILMILIGKQTFASFPDLTLNFGIAGSLGQLGNSQANLKTRTMNAFRADSYLGLGNKELLLGPYYEIFWQGQSTPLAYTSGTNLKGRGFLAGIGLLNIQEGYSYFFGLGFIGKYELEKSSALHQDTKLSDPLAVKLKYSSQFDNWPGNITFDISLGYTSYQKFQIGNSEKNWTSQEFSVGLGLTYRFLSSKNENFSASDRVNL